MVNIADAEFDSCTEDKTLSGIFCQEMIVRRDMGQLEVPSIKDMEDGVEGLTKITECDATKDKEARSREEERLGDGHSVFYLIS